VGIIDSLKRHHGVLARQGEFLKRSSPSAEKIGQEWGMTKVLLIGPGAIGGTVAGWLSTLPAHELYIAARGSLTQLKVEHAEGVINSEPVVLTSPDELSAPVDWIIVATKAYDADAASRWFTPALGRGTRLAVLQNGVEHVKRFAPWFDPERILPVIIDCPAERLAPGHIRQRGPAQLTVPAGVDGRDFAALFEGTPFEITLTDDFITAAWWKLCLNAAGVVSALTLRPAEVMQVPAIAELAHGIVQECADVGRAVGADLADDIAESMVARYRSAPPDSVNSLHGDRLAGRMGEVDARHGVIIREGVARGVPTPLNQMAVTLLEATAQV
jgi:2-dehydropantoate 2-reductase